MVSEGHGVKRFPNADETASLADPRHTSLLGASWLALTLSNLYAAGGIASITCYDAFGWNGVMERIGEPTFSSLWPELAGTVYPAYHVLAWIGMRIGGELLPMTSSAPLRVGSMALRRNGELSLLVCNLTNEQQHVRMVLPERYWRAKTLHPGNVLASLIHRDFLTREPGEIITSRPGMCNLSLPPYALAFLEGSR
jgi:hypothetical protein